MQITLDIPESLLARLNTLEQRLPQVLGLGLDELAARPSPTQLQAGARLTWRKR